MESDSALPDAAQSLVRRLETDAGLARLFGAAKYGRQLYVTALRAAYEGLVRAGAHPLESELLQRAVLAEASKPFNGMHEMMTGITNGTVTRGIDAIRVATERRMRDESVVKLASASKLDKLLDVDVPFPSATGGETFASLKRRTTYLLTGSEADVRGVMRELVAALRLDARAVLWLTADEAPSTMETLGVSKWISAADSAGKLADLDARLAFPPDVIAVDDARLLVPAAYASQPGPFRANEAHRGFRHLRDDGRCVVLFGLPMAAGEKKLEAFKVIAAHTVPLHVTKDAGGYLLDGWPILRNNEDEAGKSDDGVGGAVQPDRRGDGQGDAPL